MAKEQFLCLSHAHSVAYDLYAVKNCATKPPSLIGGTFGNDGVDTYRLATRAPNVEFRDKIGIFATAKISRKYLAEFLC